MHQLWHDLHRFQLLRQMYQARQDDLQFVSHHDSPSFFTRQFQFDRTSLLMFDDLA